MMKNRIFSLLLVVAMLVSMLPVIANAEGTQPTVKTSLTLNSILSVNIKVDPQTADLSGSKVRVYIGEDTLFQEADGYYTEDNTGYAVFTARLPVHRLAETLKIQLLDENDGTLYETEWTAAGYFQKAVAEEPECEPVTAALQTYGEAAAYYHNPTGTAPTVADVDAKDLSEYKSVADPNLPDLEPKVSLYLDDACNIRVKFSKEVWDNGNYQLYVDDSPVTVEDSERGEQVVYQISGIIPQNWSTDYTIQVKNSEGTVVYQREYCVLSYVYQALNGATDNTALLDLLKSMYLYQAAVVYYMADKYEYTLTYDPNYGELPTVNDSESGVSTQTSQTFTVDANPFYRPGYKFTGWERSVSSTKNALNEDFGSGLPENWSYYDNAAAAETGVWSVTDGALHFSQSDTSKSGNSAAISDTKIEADDYELTADVVVTSAGSVGLVWAVSDDAETMHYFRIFGSSGQYKLYAGQITGGLDAESLGIGAANGISINDYVSGNQKVTIKVKVEGQKYTIFINEYSVSGTTTADNLHGRVGAFLRNGPAATKNAFDNICVKTTETVVTSPAIGEKLEMEPDEAVTLFAQWESINVLLNEDFSDASVLDTWTQYEEKNSATEKWSVDAANGVLKYVGTQTSNSALLSDTAITADNYELTTTFYFPDFGAQFGLIFASDDSLKNFHYFRVNVVSGGYYRLYVGHVKDGTLSSATSYQYSGAATGATNSQYLSLNLNRSVPLTVKIVVEGTKFSIYGGDDLWLEADAATEGWSDLGGKVGIFLRVGANATNYTFDDVKVTSSSILMDEDFNTMAAEVPDAWTQVNQSGQSGSWGIAGGALQYTGEGENPNGKVLLFDTVINEDNYEITANVKLYENTTGKSIGFVFGSNSDTSSFHYFRIWSNGNYIISAGSDSTLANLKQNILEAKGTTGVNALSGTTIELKLRVEGQKFTIYVNGTKQQEGTTTAENLHGYFGVLLRGDVTPNAYDDILVEKITVTPAAAE